MNKNNIKLGLFVLAGFALLMAVFVYIGKNNGLFTSKFELRANFKNSNGLQKGSNVLFSGMQAGTVKSIELKGENNIEVVMLLNKDIAQHIQNTATVSIGTEGIIGNSVINIEPANKPGKPIQENDYLSVSTKPTIDDMLNALSKSNDNIQDISQSLKNTALKIENSEIVALMDNKDFSNDLKMSLLKIYQSTGNIEQISSSLNQIMNDTKQGKGAAGLILSNKSFEDQLKSTFQNINTVSQNLHTASGDISTISTKLQLYSNDLENGKGPLNALMKDTALTNRINASLYNIEKGTDGFNQNMEAMKHNFLFRGYFRKQEKEAKKNNDKMQQK